MADAQKSSVNAHRERMKQQGIVRVEVQVRKEYAGLVRGVATALGDPTREARTRELLRERIVPSSEMSLKELLASAPLEGIEIGRPRDFGRKIKF